MPENSLELFDKLTASWFEKTLGKPTPVQEEAWPAIAAGRHTLVSAPTGTGKTLSAFLVFIDKFLSELRAGSLKNELQLIYVSPLKSLASDIRENLKRPLLGILEEERDAEGHSKGSLLKLNIAVRTGDTSQNERRSMLKKPPHILITTPESLYLLLTSKSGKKMLSTAKAIIIDELHALIDSKRGAHLMLSIARLDRLCERPLQRIGLSATIQPLDKAAEYLSPDPVTIVAPRMHKDIRLEVTSPRMDSLFVQKNHIWYELARKIYDMCQSSRSVIAFVDGRAYAERLAYFVNQIGGEGYARTHHGSLSKEQRLQVELALRNGELKLLVATSSMELGIDVGEIDMVFQIGCPRTIASTLQRLGRAGHNPGRTSIMHILPRHAAEGLYCGLTAEIVRRGEIENIHPPRLCLDVLAQHLVSMACDGGYSINDVMEILPRAYPFVDVTKDDVKDILAMLAGDYEHERNVPARPRLLYDRIHEWVEGDAYSRMLAISAGGTIPDKIAGELEVPIEWLELLAQKEQAAYIEPGLWIAAEHLPKYQAAFEEGDYEARKQIVLRLIRYRGAQSAELISERYLWEQEIVEEILKELAGQGAIVESNGLYYHAELYERARLQTIKSRRAQIKTRPAQSYAAIMARRIKTVAPPQELLEKSLELLADQAIPAEYWEGCILPARIGNYRPEMLDNLLIQGNFFWRMNDDQTLSFGKYEDIDWDADLSPVAEDLEGNEKIIYEALLKRGASFMQRLSGLVEDETPYEVLGRLILKGLVSADSFLPIRQLINKEIIQRAQAKRRALVRAKAMTTGRYELVRPLKELSTEELLEREFDRAIILCRETIKSLPWAKALETLRVWEYTGKVRRGYFIEGLSGIQFIRDKDFTKTMQELENPNGEIVWIPAVDPFQLWGKILKHIPDRSFLNVPQTVVALYSGRPVAVLERQGKVLRVFEDDKLAEALNVLVTDFNKKRIFPAINRITIKQYPELAADMLIKAGFRRELQDYVLYRSSL